MKLNLDLNIHIYLLVFHENTTLIAFPHRSAAHVLLIVTLIKHIQLNFEDCGLGLRPALQKISGFSLAGYCANKGKR
jgi:hypothetical protein